MAGALALLGACGWGVGDFLGGLASRRLSVLTVLGVSQIAGLVLLSIWVLVAGEPFPGATALLPAAVAGVVLVIGLGALYQGLAIGVMGIVAPISASYPLIPLAVDAVRGLSPSALQWAGAMLVLVGIGVISREPTPDGGRLAAGVVLALTAAVAFGVYIVGIDLSSDESAPWTALVVRIASVAVVVGGLLATSTSLRAPAALLPVLVLIGLVDGGANATITLATTKGAAGIVAVLSALYPLVTIALARVFLGERLSLVRRMGGIVALGGAALVAAG
ncbi:MAG TPA: DMT family transporter [Gaiellaceae bacterium]|nr:DMT family transporter [Gaiellaceae bacterium]